jgi:GDP-4-dehydro-6-deoxy-D-mannose reductase
MEELNGPVLVTGANGFVGTWFLKSLADRKIPAWAAVRRLESTHIEGVSEVVFDLEDPSSIYGALDKTRPWGIVHLAGMASPHISNLRPESVYNVNFLGTQRLLEACKVIGIKPRVLLVGSATVYGKVQPEDLPLREDRAPRPADAYSLSKAAAEMLAPLYSEHFPVVVARPFNHTGPGQGTDFVLPSFAAQIARIERGLQPPLLKVGDLSSERDFLDVRDVVDAYIHLLTRGAPGTAYNVCSGHCSTVSRWLEMIAGESSIPVEIATDPHRVFPQPNPRLVGDNSRLRALGWSPRIQPREMIRELVQYWRDRMTPESP